MYYKEFSPIAALRPYVRPYLHVWVSRKRFQAPADGCASMMISTGDPFVLGFENGRSETVSGCRILGPSTRWSFTWHAGETNLIIVKFMPGQLSRFFPVPATELTNGSTGLESLWGKSGRELEQRLISQTTIPEITRLLDEVLLSRLSSHPSPYDERIPTILNYISSCQGRVLVEDIADKFALSRRQLERLFAFSIGLPPKRICRISRFLSSVSSVPSRERFDWAELAYAHAYSDQAHFIRECKFFTGYSPISYVKNRSSHESPYMCTVEAIPE